MRVTFSQVVRLRLPYINRQQNHALVALSETSQIWPST
jgi:hypothetical protein